MYEDVRVEPMSRFRIDPQHLSWSNRCKDSSPTTNPISFVAWQQAATQGLPRSDVLKIAPLSTAALPLCTNVYIFLHCNQFFTTYQVVIFNELFKQVSDLWFTLTEKNGMLLTGRTDGGDEKRHNGVSLQSVLAFKHKSFIVCLRIDDTLLRLNAFYFLVTPNTAACHWLCRFLVSASFPPSFPSAYYCSAFMLHSGTTGAVVTNICTCGASNTGRKTPTCLPVARY